MNSQWFESWFDSPYYPMLYRHRDTDEAEQFLQNLYSELKLTSGLKVRDMACGHGRHAGLMANLGWEVTGTDLSPASIQNARNTYPKVYQFEVHDMRHPYSSGIFDIVFNLFTSLGYFSAAHDDLQALEAAYLDLKSDGILVIDFFNAEKVYKEIQVPIMEEKQIEQIQFITKKYIQDGIIYKDIKVKDGASIFHYREQVRLYDAQTLASMLKKTGFRMLHHWGDYALNPYHSASPRCIWVAQK